MTLSFQSRIALLFAALFVAVQALTVVCIYVAVRDNLLRQLDQDLRYAEQAFRQLLVERAERVAGEAGLLVADFGFRSTVTGGDPATIASALENLLLRIHGQRGLFIDPQFQVLADSAGLWQGRPFPYAQALANTDASRSLVWFGVLDGHLQEWALVPVLAPLPVGWVAVAQSVDDQRIARFRQNSLLPLHIGLAELSADGGHLLAASAPDAALALLHSSANRALAATVDTPQGRYLGRILALPAAGDDQGVAALLQIKFTDAFAGYRHMLLLAAGVLLLGLLATLTGSVVIARNLSRPLRALAGAGERAVNGDFTASPLAGRSDELGRLADTFVRAAQLAGQLGELRQKDQERRELVASMSHDLRTPLAALRAFLETMQRKAETLPATEQQHFLDTALRQTEKVSRLAQELFELAKLECDGASLSPEPFNLAELLQDVAQKYRLQAEQRGVSLQAELRPELPLVSADIGLIERLLTNLIDNALRHTPPGGRVRLDAWPARGRITVAVRDTGIGIAPEYLPTLCDWDSPLARRARADGGGFGLIVVGKIAQLHGGRLQVESALGVGSEFRFDLPLADSARTATGQS
ncbi:HAMP domain-containing sensor histidine kinase [Methylomonas fluvii]|uniref:histidine kinase n=1 Tax=Methylomonas fluvii TaxID=1854564 RepID=A0ABR9DB30_9GAMM|nr:HAMP domain-containing sensor histidine kinase [Methylomonas fluvii]MBD9360300.1 HAMP domain-containing histidine kinase [Methylomonas fluvii]CAD6873099.1 Two-component system sensor histidine kinase [Methylomonas fluvii]